MIVGKGMTDTPKTEEAGEPPERKQLKAVDGESFFRSTRFLAIDDDKTILDVVDAYLKLAGARMVVKAASVPRAVDLVRDPTRRVDFIVCDQGMSEVTGLEFLRHIRMGKVAEYGIPAAMPFLMLTGHAEPEVVKLAAAFDVSGYVVKPIKREPLINGIRHAAARHMTVKDSSQYAAVQLPDNLKGDIRLYLP
jgi:DNA-binding NarL/FixJ family response regulator